MNALYDLYIFGGCIYEAATTNEYSQLRCIYCIHVARVCAIWLNYASAEAFSVGLMYDGSFCC